MASNPVTAQDKEVGDIATAVNIEKPMKPLVKQRKRLNLDLTLEAYELLQRLAEESGKNMADVLRIGLALYDIAQDAQKSGRSLGVIKDDKVIKEVITT